MSNIFKNWITKIYGKDFKHSPNYAICTILTRKGWLACKREILKISKDCHDIDSLVKEIEKL